MRQGSARPAARALLTWCLAVLAGAEAGAQSEGLFSAVDTAAAPIARAWAGEPGTSLPRTIRSRPVRIDLGMLDVARSAADGARSPETLTLNLFEDAVFRARVERSTPTRSGYTLTGPLEDIPFGTMALVVNGQVVAGTVRTLEATWQIRSAGAGLYLIREVDLSTLPPGADPLDPMPQDPRLQPAGGAGPFVIHRVDSPTLPYEAEPLDPTRDDPFVATVAGVRADAEATDDDGAVIDVLVLHTPAAREAEGGTAPIEALVDLWVAETNQAYADSGVIHRIELVGQAETDYAETGEAIPALGHLTDPRDGHMDDAHLLRDAYAADIVHLVFSEAEDACGVAWLMLFPEHDYEDNAFTLSGLYCTAYSFAHELGHAMGLRHDRYAQPDENRPYPYSAGYVNQRAFDAGASESSRWRTVMAYDLQCADAGFSCPLLLRFSNPDQTHLRDPLGVPGDAPTNAVDGPADARRGLNDTRSIVAGFRSSRDRAACKPVFRPERQFVPADGGAFEVSLTIHHECDWTAATEAAFVSLTGAGGAGSGVLTYEVAANEGRGRAGRVTVSGHSLLVEQVGPVNEGICDRTLPVQQAIVQTAGADHCWNVTSGHLSSIRWLNLHGHRVGALKAGDFAGLSGMRQLSLSGNDLTVLPAGIFEGLSGLELLGLFVNGLTSLPEDLFQGLSGLKLLNLSDNNLRELPGAIFSGLSSLEELYVGSNDLTTLPGDLFASLSGLTYLSLAFNDLEALPGGIFAGLSNLDDLILIGNALTSLPEEVFAGLSGLRVLWLGSNALSALPAGLFADLSSLEDLIFQHNDLTALPEGIFAGLDNLQLLWMGANSLTTLREDVFSGLPGLESLSLAGNPLGSLPERVFAGRSRVRFLDLADMELTLLPAGLFADLTALEHLWLFDNELTSLPTGVFSGLTNLHNLELDRNPGAPFTLTLQLVRTEYNTSGGAVAVEVAEGAPFDMASPLSATGATLSADVATIAAGGTVGVGVGVTRRSRTATVRPGPPPEIPRGARCGLPRCFTGIRLVTDGLVEFSARAPFTDDPLHPGVTRVKAIHFLELRERIDLLRQDAGVPRYGWTDPSLTSGVTVRRAHLAELRSALADVYAAAGRPSPAYTDPALPQGTVIRAAHLMELRAAVVALEDRR